MPEYQAIPCLKQEPIECGYRVWIHSETRTWHDNNIHSNAPCRQVLTAQFNYLDSLAKGLSVPLRTKRLYVRIWLLCTTNVHINYVFILSNNLNSPNLYINWASMWYPDYHNRKLNLCMLNSFEGFHLYIK